MKRNSLFFLFPVLALMNCGGTTPRKLRLELPAPSILHPEEFHGIVLTDFLIDGSPEGFDLSRELSSFFAPEFKRKLSLPVTERLVPIDSEECFGQPDFWKALSPESSPRLYVTGKAMLTREVRKSILGEVPGEDPFTPERKIAERNLFTLSLRLLLIRGDSGEVLLDREFKEAKTYANPDQRNEFAFYDLAIRVKGKLFRPLSGEGSIQERYLLPK